MARNPFAPPFETLPASLAIFPLSGVLLLPNGNLPLNIFEPRYLKMVEDAMATHRMIGMIQPRPEGGPGVPIYDIGCAGKITEFSETADGRYLITLTGICRFQIAAELDVMTPYRQVKTNWEPYRNDIESVTSLDVDRSRLVELLRTYFTDQGMDCDWGAIENAPDGKLITCLSMICPFDAKEKQALLEAACCKTRAKTFMAMLEMAVHNNPCGSSKH
jgi:Lon protease-like protein